MSVRSDALRRTKAAFRRRREFISGWRRLASHERRDLIRLAILIPCLAVALRVVGFNRLKAQLARSGARSTAIRPEQVEDLLGRAIERASRYARY